jgi:hypothetical protein
MKRRIVFAIIVSAVLVAGAVIGGAWAYIRFGTRDTSCGLAVSKDALCLGTVWWQPHFKWQLSITNPTDDDIEIMRFQRSCQCVSVEPPSLAIPAKSTRNVTLALNLTRTPSVSTKEVPSYRWEYSVSIVPDLRAGVADSMRDRVQWRLHGQVQVPWIASPETIDFGNQLPASVGATKVSRIICEQPLSCLWATCDQRLGAVKLEKQDDHGTRYLLSVSLKQNIARGYHDIRVDLTGVSREGKRLCGPPIQVRARVNGAAEAVPESLVFGAKLVGEIASTDLLLRPTGEKRFTLKRIRADSPSLEVRRSNATELAAGEYAFRVSQRVSARGQHSSVIALSVQTGDSQESQDVIVPVSYFGISNPDH